MSELKRGARSAGSNAVRSDALFHEHLGGVRRHVDRLFVGLLLVQWIVGIAVAIWISPRTWIGAESAVHVHVWAAIFLGGAIVSLPVAMGLRFPGAVGTRHVIAAGQMLWSALFIHLSGGRIESHFHVFGSLAFVAFYRDWRVLATAALVVSADHLVRGVWWPQSVFGVLSAGAFRWLEHAGWVAFEVMFLTFSCARGVREIRQLADRQAELEQTNARIEATVVERTRDLQRMKLAVDRNSEAVFWIDRDGAFLDVNDAACRLLRHDRDTLLGMSIGDVHDDMTCDGWAAQWAALRETGSATIETGLRAENGETIPVLVTSNYIDDGERQLCCAFAHDVSEQRRTSAHLQAMMEAAEQANLAKSEFLASMSHELRTPLNAIIGFTDGLLERVDRHPLNDHQKNRLTRVKAAGRHLLLLINDVLDIAKVEAGEMHVNTTTFDPADLAREVADMTEALVAEKHEVLEFALAVDDDIPSLHSDRDKIKQILVNLMSNAVKFTERGRVALSIHRDGERVQFSCEDTGVGIPADEIDRVFDKFHQVGGVHKEGGTGLGLALCRELAELIGATLAVRSIVGHGSTFTLTAPCAGPAAPAAEHDPLVSSLIDHGGLDARRPGQRRVLCIEDNHANMLLLHDCLTEAGCQVVPLFDGTDAVAVARRVQPDLIVLDVMMPHVDGWEVLRRLKADEGTRHMPVVLATARDDQDLGLALGASDYIVKPIDRSRLLESVRTAVGSGGTGSASVAVVDDDPAVRDVLTDLLQDQGFEVRAFEDGGPFLDALATWRPDAILLDLMMPRVNGFEVVERMRAIAPIPPIPTIVLTAMILSSSQLLELNREVEFVIEKNGLSREATLSRVVDYLAAISEGRLAA